MQFINLICKFVCKYKDLNQLYTAGKGYGNLAANNGPTSEKPFTNTISNQSFNYSKESVFRQFRTSPASHSWEALNSHMWQEKPIQGVITIIHWIMLYFQFCDLLSYKN